jgi:class 3 adenylate cyclase
MDRVEQREFWNRQERPMSNLFDYLHELLSRNIHPTEKQDEIWQRFGRRVAIMMLDSSGFSRTTQQHGIVHFLSQLMQMRTIIGDICAQNRSHAFRFEADNVYTAFDHPDDAIRAAWEIHGAIDERGLMLNDEEPFRVCIGIGFGDMLYSETLEGYFGEEVNLASKLGEDTAEGGETLISAAAYGHASQALRTDFVPRVLSLRGIEAAYYRHLYPGSR